MNYIERQTSLLTGEKHLEPLYTFRNFPVYMGCVNEPRDNDLLFDMVWNICKDTGLIQLGKLLPLEVLYLSQHNDGVGQVWQDHYRAFAKFLAKYESRHILEIGGAHDHIFKYYQEYNNEATWTTVEPNPQIGNSKIKVIKAWFDDTFTYSGPVDTVVHSHVFEHMYNPFLFISQIAAFLQEGDKHIFSFPNMVPMLERKFTNCLNFEHTVFLTEKVTDYILQKSGFKIIEKEYYGDPHSIFYATEKIGFSSALPVVDNEYEINKKLFTDYIFYHKKMVTELNALIMNNTRPVYLFGAHIFSQTLIQFGLQTDKIVAILDNSELKNKKRLYGTNLYVESPKILTGQGQVNVILKAGIYNEEIKKDILENINDQVVFW